MPERRELKVASLSFNALVGGLGNTERERKGRGEISILLSSHVVSSASVTKFISVISSKVTIAPEVQLQTEEIINAATSGDEQSRGSVSTIRHKAYY